MIDVCTTIKDHFTNASLGTALGDQLADRCSGGGSSTVLDSGLDVLVERRRGGQCTACRVVDDLSVDILVRAENAETGTTEGTSLERLADTSLAAFRTFCTDSHCRRSLLLLAFFAEDVLASIANALALVGLWLAPCADLGRNLTHGLLVNSTDDDFRRRGDSDRDSLGGLVDHFMAETKQQLDILALHGSAITNALDRQLLFEARRNTGDHVLDQCTGGAPGGARKARVVGRRNNDAIGAILGIHDIHEHNAHLALRALDAYITTIDRNRNAAYRCNRLFAST